MFGNDDGGDDGGMGWGQLLFNLWLWRELDSGRISAGDINGCSCLLLLIVLGGLGLLFLVAGAV